jgi:hypothetical protein
MREARAGMGDPGGEGVFGWFREVGFLTLVDLLPAETTQVSQQDVDGVSCYVLSGDSADFLAVFLPFPVSWFRSRGG